MDERFRPYTFPVYGAVTEWLYFAPGINPGSVRKWDSIIWKEVAVTAKKWE